MNFKEIFTGKKVANFIINELLGKFIGFIVGMWASKFFSHQVYEKKGLNNLFGLAKRKKITVNDTPEWLQWIIAAVVGFIVLELISYFFEQKLYLSAWNFIKKKLGLETETLNRNKNLVE